MQSIEQLEEILENAPDKATHVCMVISLPDDKPNPVYVRHMKADTWLRFNPKSNNYGVMKKSGINFLKCIRSLADIKLIVEMAGTLQIISSNPDWKDHHCRAESRLEKSFNPTRSK